MRGELKERWMLLCEQAANEQDGEKLVGLVEEITRLLDDKLKRVSASPFKEEMSNDDA